MTSGKLIRYAAFGAGWMGLFAGVGWGLAQLAGAATRRSENVPTVTRHREIPDMPSAALKSH